MVLGKTAIGGTDIAGVLLVIIRRGVRIWDDVTRN